jgi:hypothetical protein
VIPDGSVPVRERAAAARGLGRLRDPDGGWVRAARAALAAALGVLVLFLRVAPKPWDAETGPGFFATRERTFSETVFVAAWWAAAANAVLALALIASARLWAGPAGAPDWGPPRRARRAGVGFLALLALAAALGGALRWNLAHGSLWWDEAWTVKRVIVGFREPAPERPGELAFEDAPWYWTLWRYKKPTNHVFYSVSARASVEAWRVAAGREPWAFDEFALRLPAFAAALASIAGVGLFVRRLATPAAGAAAAFLLAIHPWHIQHSAEARAYAFVVALALLSAHWLARALRDGAWRHFALYGGAQVLLFWSHPFSIYLSAALGACGLAGLALAPAPPGTRLALAARWVVTHVFAAMAILTLMGPNLAQTVLFTDVNAPSRSRVVGAESLRKLTSLLFTGMPLEPSGLPADRPAFTALADVAERHAFVRPLVLVVLPTIAALGLVRLALTRGPARFAVLGLALAVPTAAVVAGLRGQFFHHRFVFYGLAAVVIGLAAGVEWLLRAPLRGRPRAARVIAAAGLALGLAGFQALVAPRTLELRERPHSPIRDALAWIAEDGGPHALRLGYGKGGDMSAMYDPWLAFATSAGPVERLARQARERGVPFYVTYGYPGENRQRFPGGFRLFDDPTLFEERVRLLGIAPEFTWRVLRYTGKPLP